MKMSQCVELVTLEIVGIPDTSDKGVQVELKSGKKVWLPRKVTQFANRRAFIPVWLAKKILPKAQENHASV